MKTIALDNSTYAKLSGIKDYLSRQRGKSISFSEVLEEVLKRPFMLQTIDPILREMLEDVLAKLSEKNEILGIVLFGSMAKSSFVPESDIDLFIIVSKRTADIFEFVESSIRKTEITFFNKLSDNNLPVYISPMICDSSEIDTFRPIFLDVADFGVILYEKPPIVSRFMEKYISLDHERRFTESGEMVSWKI